jgi:uncharacterized membrane protein YqiK
MFSLVVVPLSPLLATTGLDSLWGASGTFGGWAIGTLAGVVAAIVALGLRYIPNTHVGIVEKLWSFQGSVSDGGIVAVNGEAGYQAELLRGGYHIGLWPWQYRIHKVPLVVIPQGKIGYVYTRDGEPLDATQTLGRVVPSNNFQDARMFLCGPNGQADAPIGQRGRQRAILREGVYAINLSLFVVMTEDNVYTLKSLQTKDERDKMNKWQQHLAWLGGFAPVIVGAPLEASDPLIPDHKITVDSLAIVTVHDGPSLGPGEIIAPPVGAMHDLPDYHNNFQDTEAFLRAGGRRGRQYQPLTDGTYFINRWFATVEQIPKTVVPIGYVGVVVSYYGRFGRDLSGEAFRHGERVAEGERGVWQRPLGPGKYAFNTYAGNIVLVPTTNFVLHWITGKTEQHRYDESLKSIDLVTRDAYEPLLPLSVVVHIDYEKAPGVIQRFGDVKKLITQTLDPMLSAFFRDVAHKKTMLELLHDRDLIQEEARGELRRKFMDFDIQCVDVLIGKPSPSEADNGKIETLLEQLRMRQLATEQLETFERQRIAAEKQRTLSEAQAIAAKQAELTNSHVQVRIADNQGEADVARSRRHAEQMVIMADAELAKSRKQAEQTVVTAQADSQKQVLNGRGEGLRTLQIGLAEATALLKKISSFGDPRLYALTRAAEELSQSVQPLVPERLFMTSTNGSGDHGSGQAPGLLGTLISLLVAEKSGFQVSGTAPITGLEELVEQMASQSAESLRSSLPATTLAASKVTEISASH